MQEWGNVDINTMTHKSPITPLVHELRQQIKIRGPLPISDFMYQCMQHPKYGYYMRREEKIGEAGDFITSPELTPIFGDLLGIWCVHIWKELGRPTEFGLVELGPGNGTLMSGILTVAKQFPDFHRALRLHLIESSPAMRQVQVDKLQVTNLQGTNDPYDEAHLPPTSPSTPPPRALSSAMNSFGKALGEEAMMVQMIDSLKQTESNPSSPSSDKDLNQPDEETTLYFQGQIQHQDITTPVAWHTTFKSIPALPSIYLAHEFFDALHVNQFVLTDRGWCERLVDVDEEEG